MKKRLTELLPNDKCDTSTIPELLKLSEKDLEELLPALYKWFADFNWPIAAPLLPVAMKYPHLLLPHVKKTLDARNPDSEMKYFVVSYVLKELPS